MRETWNFYTAAQLTFGPGAVRQLGDLATRHRLSRIYVVTDRTLVDLGMAERVVNPLQAAGMTVGLFDGGEAEPSINVALNAIERAREFKPDAILGLGGGSNMDLSKITATVLEHGSEYKVLATNTLDDRFDATPAIVDGEIYLRGRKNLYCIAE